MLDTLNAQFMLTDRLRFESGPRGLPVVVMQSTRATATVALHGGHVLSFQPNGFEPVLWMSDHSVFQSGKAIRGGIPVCWPWFGPHPSETDKPNHGFARTSNWSIFSTRVINDDDVQLRLLLTDDAQTRALWPHAFELELCITLSERLRLDLHVRNTGQASFTWTGALHTYFPVSHINTISVHGLDGCQYIDQLTGDPQKIQHGPIQFTEETDNIYVDTDATCILDDAGSNRRVIIEKSGSQSTVVWNPWIKKAARMSDFGDDEYLGMVCIETANAAQNRVSVPAGQTHVMSATIRAEAY